MNIDNYIKLFNHLSNNEETLEFKEQDAAGGASGGGGSKGGYPTVTKWETGMKRGTANPVKLGKWKDVVTLTRGKSNTLL